MFTIWDFIWGVVVPSTIATAFAAVGWRLWRLKGEGLPEAPWAAPVGMGLGMFVGIVGLMSLGTGNGLLAAIPWTPRASAHWLPWIGLATAALAVAGLVPQRAAAWVHAALSAMVAAFVVAVIVYLRQRTRLGDVVALGLSAGLVVAAALVVASNELAARRLPGWLLPLHLTIVGTALAVALGATGTAKLAQYGGVLCAVTGPWIVAGLIRREFRLATGGIAAFVAMAMVLAVSGVLYSKLPLAAGVLLAVAAAAPGVALIPVPEARAAWLRPVLSGAAGLVLVAVAMVVVARSPAALGG